MRASAGLILAVLAAGACSTAAAQMQPGSERSGQRAGESGAAKSNSAVPAAGAQTGESPSSHTRDVRGSEQRLSLSQEQRERIRGYLAQHRDADVGTNATFTVSIGAAVPRQAGLRPLPRELTDTLQGYRGDSYVMVGDTMVIATRGRRIAAIIPNMR